MNSLLASLLVLAAFFNVTKEDVRRLLDAGVSNRTLVEYIKRNAPAAPLSVEDIAELKHHGASDEVLQAMLQASRTSDAVTPSHPPEDSYPSSSYSYAPSYSTYSTPYYGPYYPSSFYYSYPYSYSYSRYYPRYYYPYHSYSYSSYYRYSHPYRYPYIYPRYTRPVPYSVSPYRGQRPQPVQPRQGVGPYRR